jgi:beta-lactamase regulating signal transducer with metallopeptidase domain
MSDAVLDAAVRSIAAALLHSLWQGLALGLATAAVLKALAGSRPAVRYLVACAGLGLMVVAWAVTAWQAAAQLLPEAHATASASAATPPLGPAGFFDFSPAIRTISQADLDAGTPSWRYRIELWSIALVPVWLLGVCGLSARLAFAWLYLERLRRSALEPVPPAIASRVRDIARRLAVSRAVRAAQSMSVQVPSVVGWLRPVVLLPASALTGLPAAHLDAIIAHELAHVRRHDFAVNLVQAAAEILLFYHPACWWISRRIRAEREHSCDDIAVSLCGDRLVYATALADLETLRASTQLALAATDGPLLQRVRRLLSPSTAPPRAATWIAALGPLALTLAVMAGATITGSAAVPQEASRNAAPAAASTIPAGSGVVRGQVVDALSGKPLAGASYEITGPNDSALGRTDAEGRFETRPIKAGSYTMSTRASGYVMGWYGPRDAPFGTPIDVRSGRVSTGIDVKMYAAGVINGRILGENGQGLRGVEIVLEPAGGATAGGQGRRPSAAFAQTIENGVYRVSAAPGDYYVRAYVGEPLAPGKDGKVPTYVSTVYPGVRVMAEGQPLRIEPGLDLFDVDFTLMTAKLVTLRGRVVDPSGDSLDGVRVAVMNMGATARSRESSVAIDAEGRFEIRDVVPGEYMLNVWDKRKTSRWVGAMKHLSLTEDMDDLEMRAATGARVIGRIVRDPLTTRRFDPTEVMVRFEKRVGQNNGLTMAGGARIDPDGSFETESPGGLVTIGVSNLPEGWTVKSIHLDRVDVDGQTVDLTGGTRQLQIMLTDRISAVTGLVVDRNGRPLSGYSIVLFPDDETRWTPSSRFLMEARSSQTGQFTLKDVAPGSYLAVALQSLPFRAWVNPDTLALLQPIATKLQVTEGEQKVISIRASPTPDGIVPR